ncbi:MAG: phage holin family protein [Clostridiales bacterium]|nr:phage holin family protein [Clostridiales bacterium]
MDAVDHVVKNAYILIPALYIIGAVFKGIKKVPDRFIPLILLFFGIAGALGLLGISVNSVIQGILITGVTVYGDQITKQLIGKR